MTMDIVQKINIRLTRDVLIGSDFVVSTCRRHVCSCHYIGIIFCMICRMVIVGATLDADLSLKKINFGAVFIFGQY